MDENMNDMEPMNNAPMPPQEGSKGMSIAGMVLGIVSIVCCGLIGIICGIVGVILSGVALKNNQPGRNMAIAGAVCSIVGIVSGIIWLVFYSASLLPMINYRLYR